jgi:hypothetical protein
MCCGNGGEGRGGGSLTCATTNGGEERGLAAAALYSNLLPPYSSRQTQLICFLKSNKLSQSIGTMGSCMLLKKIRNGCASLYYYYIIDVVTLFYKVSQTLKSLTDTDPRN